MSMTRRIQNARPCVEKMQFIFFVPPNEELEGTLHPQKFGCTPKNEGKRVDVPPDEKTCGHAEVIVCFVDIGRIVDHHCLNFFSNMYM